MTHRQAKHILQVYAPLNAMSLSYQNVAHLSLITNRNRIHFYLK